VGLAFMISANTTDAVSPNGSTRGRLQTGSVAATVTITPSFAMHSVKPDNPGASAAEVQGGALGPAASQLRQQFVGLEQSHSRR
jgi:hypothetical protein